MKKSRFNVFISLASGLILVLVAAFTNGLEGLIHQLSGLDLGWIVFGVVFMVLYWVVEGVILHCLTQFLYEKQRFLESFKVTMIGQFFNAVTPFASGGQPAQLYTMIGDGIDPGVAGSILMAKFIIYQAVLTVYSLLIILYKVKLFRGRISHFVFLAVIGFLVNTAVILLAIMFSKNRKLTHGILVKISKCLKWLHIIKDEEDMQQKMENELMSFHQSSKLVKNDRKVLTITSILTVIQLTLFFSIPYCIYKAFYGIGAPVVDMISAQAFVTMTSSFIPLPGAAGGAEGSFYLFFGLFFHKKNMVAAILLWRMITFYSCIGFGGLTASLTNARKVPGHP